MSITPLRKKASRKLGTCDDIEFRRIKTVTEAWASEREEVVLFVDVAYESHGERRGYHVYVEWYYPDVYTDEELDALGLMISTLTAHPVYVYPEGAYRYDALCYQKDRRVNHKQS